MNYGGIMKSVTQKFVFTIVLLLLVSTGAVFFVSAYYYSKPLEQALNGKITEAQQHFTAITDAVKRELLDKSALSAKYDGLDVAMALKDVESVVELGAEIMKTTAASIVTITDEKGNILTRAHSKKTGDSIIHQDSIIDALKGNANTSLVMGVAASSFRASSPVYYNGKIVGTISIGNAITNTDFFNWLSNFLHAEVTFFAGDKRLMTTLKDAQGKLIVGTTLDNQAIKNQVLNEGKVYFGNNTILNVEYLSSYWPAKNLSGKIIGMWFIGLPVSDVLKTKDAAFMSTIAIAGAVIALMLAIAIFICIKLSSPIKKIATYASAVAKGDEDAQINIETNDEYGILSHSIQDMVQKLKRQSFWYESILNCIPSPLAAMDKDRNFIFVNSGVCNMLGKKPEELIGLPCYNWGATICRTENCAIESCEKGINSVNFEQPGLGYFRAMAARLYDNEGNHAGYVDMVFDRNQEVQLLNDAEKALADGRHDAANQLENIVENIATASEQLTSQIAISTQGSETASMRMTETATAMDEMNSTVLEVAKNSNNSAELAEETKVKSSESAQVIKQCETTMLRLREESIEIRSGMSELADHAQSINAVMSVISDIADQTNLLALNAAIEAARAGEAGRGFAVVADEVRKLAEKTMTSTADVSNAIIAIQQSTEINVRQIDATVKSIEEATELAISSGEALAGILHMAEESADGIRAIATASEEQSATSDEIASSIAEVANVVNDNTNAMQEATNAVNLLSSQSQKLSELIEELKK